MIFRQMLAAVLLVVVLADEKIQVGSAVFGFAAGGAEVEAFGAGGHCRAEVLAALDNLPAAGLHGVGRADAATDEEADQMSGVGDVADQPGKAHD